MRIEFSVRGGIAYTPRMGQPVAFDTAELDPAEAKRLAELVAAAGFFDRPAQVGEHPPGAADMQHYVLAIEDGGRRHQVVIAAPVADEALGALVKAVREHVGPLRSADR